MTSLLRPLGLGHFVSEIVLNTNLLLTNVQLTVCTDRPLWGAELVVGEAGEAVVVLAVVADKPVVGGARIALVQHRLIVGRGVVGVPHQQEAAVAGGAGGLHTVGPCSVKCLCVLLYLNGNLHSQLSAKADSDQVLLAWQVTLVCW